MHIMMERRTLGSVLMPIYVQLCSYPDLYNYTLQNNSTSVLTLLFNFRKLVITLESFIDMTSSILRVHFACTEERSIPGGIIFRSTTLSYSFRQTISFADEMSSSFSDKEDADPFFSSSHLGCLPPCAVYRRHISVSKSAPSANSDPATKT